MSSCHHCYGDGFDPEEIDHICRACQGLGYDPIAEEEEQQIRNEEAADLEGLQWTEDFS